MDKNTRIYYATALALKLPVNYISEINGLHIRLGKKNYYFLSTVTPLNEGGSIYLAKNKAAFLHVLRNAGFPVPNGIAMDKDMFSSQRIAELVQNLNFPLVAKPMINTHGGVDVICNIKTLSQLTHCLEAQFKKYFYIQIEEFQQGLKEYRVLLLKNRVIGVVERIPVSVLGDGIHSIEQLIIQNNQNISEHAYPITINEELHHCLSHQNLTLNSIPFDGETLRLQYAVNRALGGRVISLGKKINAENTKILSNIATLSGLDWVGFDLLCEDINKPFSQTRWVILEANFGPGMTMHEYPDSGVKIQASKKLLKQLILQHPVAYVMHRLNRLWKKDKKING